MSIQNSHLQLIEGNKSQRDKFISKVEVLNRVKDIVFLPYQDSMTTKMVADYYNVEIKTVRKLTERNMSEFIEDGYLIAKDNQLSDIKTLCQIQSRAKTLALYTRQAVLRVGMLLRDSEVAIQIRNYLLDIESKVSDDIKLDVLESYFDKLDSEIKNNTEEMIKIIRNENLYIIERVNASENEIIKTRKELTEDIKNLSDRLSIIENSLIFKQYSKPTHRFESSLCKYGIHFNLDGFNRYSKFYNDFENWLSIKLPRNKNFTTKEYLLENFNIDLIEMFIDGIISGRIVKSDKNYFVDLNGVFCNPVEWDKIKLHFNNECAYCGTKNDPLIEEHIIPQSHIMTSDIIKNIVPACKTCNKSKNNDILKLWYPKQSFFDEDKYHKIKEHYHKYNIK